MEQNSNTVVEGAGGHTCCAYDQACTTE